MVFNVSGVLLDACVLGALSSSPAYGYELTQKAQSLLGVSESTLYPVLRRLLADGLLSSYDEPFDGRNRRYYRITDGGAKTLGRYADGWRSYKETLDIFLCQAVNDETTINESTNGGIQNEQE